MLSQTGGSILAARLATRGDSGWAINLGGGFHHAWARGGSGFCVYADITLAVAHLRSDFPEVAQRVMIVDLDAHQGNGHERDFLDDDNTFIFDAYNNRIFPGDDFAAGAIKAAMHTGSGRLARDDGYLGELRARLERAMNDFGPQFVVYNAGTDCLEGDPLGRMHLSEDAIVARDEFVFGACFERGIPVMMLLSGGYQASNARVIARSIENLDAKFKLGERRARSRSGTDDERSASR
eukprot:Amastigsp_a179877_34.p1 type:complete len:237 gc:universal Amastigsp_a179877_34:284-994(+)